MAVVALAWSGGWIAGKLALVAAPPLAMSAVRFVLASAILLVLARIGRAQIPWRRWRALLVLGATGVFGYNTLVFTGLVSAPASDGGLIVPTFTPVLAAVLAAPFANEPLTRGSVAGLFVSGAGVVLIVAGGSGLEGGSSTRLVGDLLILGGAACWALYTVVGKAVLRAGSPLGITAAASTIGGAMLIPLAFVRDEFATLPSWPLEAWGEIAFLAIASTVIGFVLFYRIVVRLGAARAAMTTYLVPAGTLVLAALLLGERVSALQLAGGALTLVGMRVVSVAEGEGAWLRRVVGV